MSRLLAAAALLVACGRQAPPPPPTPGSVTARTAPAPAAPPARRFCPPGTEPMGAEPPAGEMMWCVDRDGRKHGPWRAWHPNGQLEEEGQFRRGKKSGTWRFFDDEGELLGTRPFRDRVTVRLCVYDKVSRRGLEGAVVQVTNVETGEASTAQTGPAGKLDVVVDAGRGRIEVLGPFPWPELQVDLQEGTARLPVALAAADVQEILRRNMGKLGPVTSCAR